VGVVKAYKLLKNYIARNLNVLNGYVEVCFSKMGKE